MYISENLLQCFISLTPKCHPEIAGRGYAWGYSKIFYRKHFNDGVATNLTKNVEKALSREVLTVNRLRKFARKACDYKLTYASFEDASATKTKIEKISKAFKAHRSALDADYVFVVNT